MEQHPALDEIMEEGSRMSGVILLSSSDLSSTILLSPPWPQEVSWNLGCSAEGWLFLVPLIPSPGSLWPYWESGSEWFFHSAGWCFNNSWLRKRGKISPIVLFVFKQYNWSLFDFTTARDPQIHAVVPFCIQGSPCYQGGANVLFLYQR